jgi:hypothetical protein
LALWRKEPPGMTLVLGYLYRNPVRFLRDRRLADEVFNSQLMLLQLCIALRLPLLLD